MISNRLTSQTGFSNLFFKDIFSTISRNEGEPDTVKFEIRPIVRAFKIFSTNEKGLNIGWNSDFSTWTNEESNEFSGLEGFLLYKEQNFIFVSTLDSLFEGQSQVTIYNRNIDNIVLKLFYLDGKNYAYSTFEYNLNDVKEYFFPRPHSDSVKNLNSLNFIDLFSIDPSSSCRFKVGYYLKDYTKMRLHLDNLY